VGGVRGPVEEVGGVTVPSHKLHRLLNQQLREVGEAFPRSRNRTLEDLLKLSPFYIQILYFSSSYPQCPFSKYNIVRLLPDVNAEVLETGSKLDAF
jgi:hypothetical protein